MYNDFMTKGKDSTYDDDSDENSQQLSLSSEENEIVDADTDSDENSSEQDGKVDSNPYWSYYNSYNFRQEPLKYLTWEDGDKREAGLKYNENPTFGYWEDYYNDDEGCIEYCPFAFNKAEEEFYKIWRRFNDGRMNVRRKELEVS